MKNVLITGGCGFIGSNFIRHVYRMYPDYRILNIDLLTYAGNPENLREIEQAEARSPEPERRYRFIKGDICDTALLESLFEMHEIDVVVNFAAETHVDRSIINMTDFIRTNIGGVRSLIEAMQSGHINRFVHISTDEIYGSVENGHAAEDASLRPSNPYSSSKAAADLIVQSFMRTQGVPALIVRGSNNYGPYQYPEKLIPLAISNLIEGKSIPIHGTGQHVRSWLHVEDFCRAIDLVVHSAPLYAIYNVSGEERTNIDILEALAKELGVDLGRHKMHINDRPGADLRYAPDAQKIKKELGWRPVHSLAQSMPGVVAWYLQNRDWWTAVKNKKEFSDHYDKQSRGLWS